MPSTVRADAPPALRPRLDDVPEALIQLEQWVCWRYELRRKRGGQLEWTKVPIDAKTGKRASSTNPRTWSSFSACLERLKADSSLDGVGFVFTDDDHFVGIDLDDCRDANGRLTESAAEIVAQFQSYAEVSPSGTGVKIIVQGKKPGPECTSSAIEGTSKIEVYETGRYFAITGHSLPDAPATVEEAQEALDELCRRLWPKGPATPRDGASPAVVVEPDDEKLLDRARSAKNGADFSRLFDDGDLSRYDDDASRADQALCSHLAFWTGDDAARIDCLFRRSKLYREKWERADYRERTIGRALESVVRNSRSRLTLHRPSPGGAQPLITIDTDEHRVVDEAIRALCSDDDLYQRGGMLVRVERYGAQGDAPWRQDGDLLRIAAVPPANLRDRMTRFAIFTRINRNGHQVAAHPPVWLVAAVDKRADWPGIRDLVGITTAPLIRPDGSICQEPGYDPATRVLYEPSIPFPRIGADVDIDDAHAALDRVLDVVCDFPFAGDEHKAAWLAALLTSVARHCFSGPAPLFLFDSNVRGAGKGLLANVIGGIVLGGELPVSSYSHDTEEMRKKITTIALAGDSVILLDNLAGRFGNDALDRALTTTRWKDRILGRNDQVDLPLYTTWFATGNNVAVGADTARRIIHVRLDALVERPEERADFKRPRLLRWVLANRGQLLADVLTVLRAYVNAGRPVATGLSPYGSFEEWSMLVRQAVVWLGLPDPCLTRAQLTEAADTSANALGELLEAWDRHLGQSPTTCAALIASLYSGHQGDLLQPDSLAALKAAIENFVGCAPSRVPNARQLGNRLRSDRRRVINGLYIDTEAERPRRSAGTLWYLHRVGEGCM